VSVIATPALAQQTGLSTYGAAPPQIQPGVNQREVDLDVTGTYETNVAGTDATIAAERGIKPEDFIVHPSAAFTFSHMIGRETGFLQGSIGYNEYIRNPRLDRSTIAIDAGGAGQISLCQGTVSGAYSRQQADIADLALVGENGKALLDVKDLIDYSVVALSTTCGHSIGLAPTFNVSESRVHNSLGELGAVDADVLSTAVGVTYRSPVLGQISLLGQYSATNYPDRFVTTANGPVEENYTTVGGGFTYVRNLGGRLQGAASVSYLILEPAANIAGFKGFTYDFSGTYAITPQLNAVALVQRATTPSNQPGVAFVLVNVYSLEADYGLGARASLALGLARTQRQYDGLITTTFMGATQYAINRVYTLASLKLGRRLALSLRLTYEQRAANFPGLSYSNVIVALGASSKF
jgi:hypothetical protein